MYAVVLKQSLVSGDVTGRVTVLVLSEEGSSIEDAKCPGLWEPVGFGKEVTRLRHGGTKESEPSICSLAGFPVAAWFVKLFWFIPWKRFGV